MERKFRSGLGETPSIRTRGARGRFRWRFLARQAQVTRPPLEPAKEAHLVRAAADSGPLRISLFTPSARSALDDGGDFVQSRSPQTKSCAAWSDMTTPWRTSLRHRESRCGTLFFLDANFVAQQMVQEGKRGKLLRSTLGAFSYIMKKCSQSKIPPSPF